ncbi:hypothetical protein B0O80DRAFT_504076 [Mortierella sp. GBAus27b]|nr:hypothetical protein B0O80DRAFT_504076 [Mortierella sp. GBAus27b]
MNPHLINPIVTPKNLRPSRDLARLGNQDVPRLPFRNDFFRVIRPKFWIYEEYLAAGYVSEDDFIHDLTFLGGCTARNENVALMKHHCRRSARFFTTHAGGIILRLIRSNFGAYMARVAMNNAIRTRLQHQQQEVEEELQDLQEQEQQQQEQQQQQQEQQQQEQ